MKKWGWIYVLLVATLGLTGRLHASSPAVDFLARSATCIKGTKPVKVLWETPGASTGYNLARLQPVAGPFASDEKSWTVVNGLASSWKLENTTVPLSAEVSISRTFPKTYLQFIFPFHHFW